MWYIIKIPAVTIVEAWTNDDTEVGAAVAADNQLECGNWSLSNEHIELNSFLLLI